MVRLALVGGVSVVGYLVGAFCSSLASTVSFAGWSNAAAVLIIME